MVFLIKGLIFYFFFCLYIYSKIKERYIIIGTLLDDVSIFILFLTFLIFTILVLTFLVLLFIFIINQSQLDLIKMLHGFLPLLRSESHFFVSQKTLIQETLNGISVHSVTNEDDLLPPPC